LLGKENCAVLSDHVPDNNRPDDEEVPAPAGAAPITVTQGALSGGPRWLRALLMDRKAALGLAILSFFMLVAIFGPLIWRGDPMASDYTATPQQPPSAAHWFGTDQQSHDVFLQMVYGTRSSLALGFSIGALATLLSVLVGMSAGYFGGWVDEVLSLLTNIVLVIPSLPLIIVLASWVQVKNDLPIIAIIGLTSWAWGARVLRSQTLAVRRRDFVLAAQVSGEAGWRIVLGEILPNMTSLVVSGFIGTTVFAIGAAAGLYFLGFGNLSEVNWFTILYWAQNSSALQTGAWWTFVVPGGAVALVGTALSLINFGIDQISNPRLRTEKVKRAARVVRAPAPVAAAGKASAR
jgi:peptide/nickel transport system permease protein